MIYCDAPEPGIKGHQGHPGVKGQQGTPGAKGDPGETAAGNFISYLFLCIFQSTSKFIDNRGKRTVLRLSMSQFSDRCN